MTRPWTPEEEAQLAALYPDHKCTEIAALLGRTRIAIKCRVDRLGLRKSGENAGRFLPGHATWNKGIPFRSGGRSVETQFRPGNRPHTWHPVGHERITDEGYHQRKLTDTGVTRRDYVNVHWIVWRAAGRDIPPGMALVFRDGDKANMALDNLELVTRAELMRRNSVHRNHPQIVELIRLRAVITRKINQRSPAA
jgi:hypothetical protein